LRRKQQALHVAHRGYVMENGRITREGSAEILLNNEEVKRAYLGLLISIAHLSGDPRARVGHNEG